MDKLQFQSISLLFNDLIYPKKTPFPNNSTPIILSHCSIFIFASQLVYFCILHPLFVRFLKAIINNRIEEMKNVSKLIRDHKRLVLGSTSKCLLENRSNENIGFQNLLRSHSYNPKPQKEATIDPAPKGRILSNNQMNLVLSDHRQQTEKMKPEEVRPKGKTLTFFHIQKREKLSLNSNQNTTPQTTKSKQVLRGKTVQPLFETAVSSGVENEVQQMLANLEQHGIISAIGNSYKIHRDHVRQLINNLAGFLGKEMQQVKLKSSCPGLSKMLTYIIVKMGRLFTQQRRNRLKIQNSTINVYMHDLSGSLQRMCLSKIARLSQQEHKLQEQVQRLVQYEQSIKSECRYSQAMIEKQKRELQQLHECAQREQQQLYRLKNQMKNAQQEYNNIMQKETKVKNFVNEQQNNKLIKQVLEEYKQIEADIYEYATYLQSNQLASDLFYEPHPFRAVEAQIDEQLKKVNMSIMQAKEKSVQQKCVIMRDFVLDSMGKFKRKDEEMGRVIEFRTKCILNFIEHMKKWLNNWQFKQQFLVNLRKEFAYDSTLLMECLQKPFDESVVGKIRELSKKIIQNYQFGNSFY